MTPRERFITALERRPPSGRVPHFELVFYLTMEAFGHVHPNHRRYSQWQQMKEREQKLHLDDMAQVYIETAERFGHDAIFAHHPAGEHARLIEAIREKVGNRYFIMLHGDSTFAIPGGEEMEEFASQMVEEPEKPS